jgi:hypothetical protein
MSLLIASLLVQSPREVVKSSVCRIGARCSLDEIFSWPDWNRTCKVVASRLPCLLGAHCLGQLEI